jgi:D-glycerate 3-kinase
LTRLKDRHPSNRLLSGRGQPGTHDLELGTNVLDELQEINKSKSTVVHLPVYDKSLHSGFGDRTAETVDVQGPIDVVVFEGWMLGFYPIPENTLRARYENPTTTLPTGEDSIASQPGREHLRGPFFPQHSLESLLQINSLLASYSERLWPKITTFIQMRPLDMGFIWEWRLQVLFYIRESLCR